MCFGRNCRELQFFKELAFQALVRTLGCDKHAGDDHVADAFDPTVDCSVSEHAHSLVAQLSATKETFEGARGIKDHIS